MNHSFLIILVIILMKSTLLVSEVSRTSAWFAWSDWSIESFTLFVIIDIARTLKLYVWRQLSKMVFLAQFGPLITLRDNSRWSIFWSRKVFEGVHFHVMNLLRKSDFGPLNFTLKFMITCPNPILVHFAILRISDFGPISISSRNPDLNRKFELVKSGPKSNLNTWS